MHKTANHSTNIVNPLTGAHIQKIKRLSREGKTRFKVLRRLTYLIQSHLDEFAWRLNHDYKNILESFLHDVN